MSTEFQARVEPQQLTGDSEITFRCGKDRSCFTQCCRGIDIVLTPYDVIRMKKRLDLASDQFLAIYTTPQLLEKTDLPVPTLKMLDDEEKSCPFVREDGCLIYEDRPASCRYYPVGHATLRPKEAEASENFYFLVKEPHCKGFDDTKWTVDSWRADQGVVEYDEANRPWTDLVVRKRSFPPNLRITKEAKAMYFMACYDLDRFMRFLTESSFTKLYDVSDELLNRVREDEVARLALAVQWLEGVLFKRGPYAVKEDKAAARMEERGKAKKE
ncbi:MAG: YkgJ family cysteine cluster protein [Deltaproteobacteria bacterium]|nr:YkgJ family cysteine cluster protein [Deltaproteobacteria bacterium]